MVKKYLHIITAGFLLLFFFTACNPTKNLEKGQKLLVKNNVSISEFKDEIGKSNVSGLITQKPNSKFLFIFKVKMWFYVWSEKGKSTKFKTWVKNKIGEPPVIYDRYKSDNSVKQIQSYLYNIGFFDAKVHYSADTNKKGSKIKIAYDVIPRTPHRIQHISYIIPDKEVKYYVLKGQAFSLIDSGQIFNAYTLESERNRITTLLQNNGYYAFNNQYIFFEVDSTIGNNRMNITINIKNPTISDTSAPGNQITEDHKKYYINNIYVNTDYNSLVAKTGKLDTLMVKIPKYHNPTFFNRYYFTYRGVSKLRPQTITQAVFINTGQPFVLEDVQQTYRRLTTIRLFNYANIQFTEVIDNKQDSGLSDKGFLDCKIQLSRAKLQSFTIEVEGTNTGGDLGVGGNLVYQNKNVFRGAELLSLRFKGALEVQRLSQSATEGSDPNFLFFNTIETGVDASLNLQRFLIPLPASYFPKYFKPKTTINIGVNFQRRPNYTRIISTLAFGYYWSESSKIKHILFPFNLNLVKVHPTPEFDSVLNGLTDERLRNQYKDHFIPSLRYSFVFNNQDINKLTNFTYFRVNFETAGNLINAIDMFANAPVDDQGYYTLFGIRYAQYVRLDFDYRYYFILNKNNRIAFRGIFGIGIPYSNSVDLPFEKGFYSGGANGMRAWRFRSLGPGSYSNTDSDFDRMGDIKIEVNAEYRFPIYKFFKGAFFIDAGNVWLRKPDKTFPGGEFKFDAFLGQIAMDMGIGLRFDFGFFLFRIDGAVKVRDPSLPASERWTFNRIGWNGLVWNFGIGYPF